MKILSMETRGSRSVPAPRTIKLPQRDITDPDEPRGAQACAQTRFWARTSNYLWAMGVVGMGLGLHFYYMREMLASLALFSLLFFALGLVALCVFFVCYAGNQAAMWAGPLSQVVIAFFQRQDRGGAELSPVLVVEDGRLLSGQESEAETQMQIGRKP
jgi:hypothetical protein